MLVIRIQLQQHVFHLCIGLIKPTLVELTYYIRFEENGFQKIHDFVSLSYLPPQPVNQGQRTLLRSHFCVSCFLLWNKLTAPPKCFFGILGSIPEVSRNDLNLEGASKLGTLWNKHISVLPLSLHPRPTAFLEHLVNLQEFGIRYSNVEFKSDLVSVLFVTATCWNLPETQHKHSAVQPLICLTTGPPTQSTKGFCNVALFGHMSCYLYSFLFRGSSWDYYVI